MPDILVKKTAFFVPAYEEPPQVTKLISDLRLELDKLPIDERGAATIAGVAGLPVMTMHRRSPLEVQQAFNAELLLRIRATFASKGSLSPDDFEAALSAAQKA